MLLASSEHGFKLLRDDSGLAGRTEDGGIQPGKYHCGARAGDKILERREGALAGPSGGTPAAACGGTKKHGRSGEEQIPWTKHDSHPRRVFCGTPYRLMLVQAPLYLPSPSCFTPIFLLIISPLVLVSLSKLSLKESLLISVCLLGNPFQKINFYYCY